MNRSAPRRAAQPAPSLHIVVSLEGVPRCRIHATSFEQELRLRHWLGNPLVLRRICAALLAGLERAA